MAVSTITITSGASTLIPTVEPVVLTLGTVGPQGIPGAGVPAGGTVNQILAKTGAANYATGWIDNYTTDVRIIAKNDSGTTLAKGTVVYVSGANGTNVLIKPAIATGDSTSATTIGLTLQSMIPNNTNWVITQGTLSGIDTSAATAGDPVWLSGTVAGGLVFGFANEPQAPTHLVYLGTVTRAHATLGSIEVKINNGWELNELHNVKITSPTNGQVLTYDSANSLWINSSETGDISAVNVTAPITGGGTSGAVTIGIDQTAITIAESQVTNLVTDLAGKVPTYRTITPATGITGGGDLSANRTIGLDNTVVSYDAASSLRSLPLYNQKDAAERLLAQAVWWIDAAHSSASGQTITNLGWGGSALNATAGSTGSADSNDPKFLDWTGTNYVYLPGAASNFLSTPNAAALQITGDIDIRAHLALDDWTPAAVVAIAGKWNVEAQKSYYLRLQTDGTLRLVWRTSSGGADVSANSSVATGITDGAAKWVRATLDVDNGASGYDVKFYLSDDGATWTQLGTTQTGGGTTSIYAGTDQFEIGSVVNGAAQMLSGNVYKVQLLSGIGGTVVLNVDTSVITSGAATSFTALTGQTVTINRATSGRKTCVVTNPLWLFGTDDQITVPDNALVNFSATESLTILAAHRAWNNQSFQSVISKGTTAGPVYRLYYGAALTSEVLRVADGTNAVGTSSPSPTNGINNVYVGVVDRGSNLAQGWLNGVGGTALSVSTVGTLSNTYPLYVGYANGISNGDFEGVAFAVFRRVLTSDEIALITNYYRGRVA